MDRVEGETIPRRILRDDEFADAAAAPRRAGGDDRGAHPRGRHRRRCPTLPAHGRARADRPAARATSTRSASRIPRSSSGCAGSTSDAPPTPAPPALVHGDFRNGNFIVGPDGIRAVLDWELAHLGDPDRGPRLAVREVVALRQRRPIVGGFGALDELLDGVRRRGRRRRSTKTRCASGSCSARVKWGVICVGQALTHLNGLRALGRARRARPPRRRDGVGPARPARRRLVMTQDRPTAAELVDRRARVPRTRRDGGDRRPRAVPHRASR